MCSAEVADKIRDGATFAKWLGTQSWVVIDAVQKLEDLADIRQLTPLCAA
jgi:hypothetical protein